MRRSEAVRPSRLATLALLLTAGCATSPARQGTLVPVPAPAAPVEELLEALKSPSPAARAAAAWDLTGAQDSAPAVLEGLRAAYADPDEKVREAAAWALGTHTPKEKYPETLYDEPPRALKAVRPVYPSEPFQKKVQGEVEIEILINAAGQVVHAELRRSIPGLDEAALACVRQWSFHPARLRGQPVPAKAFAPVTFRIY